MAGRFADQVVLVTGATSGIGWETALAFRAEGAKVAGTGRDAARLGALRKEVPLAIQLDVTDEAAVDAVPDEVERALGPVDVLINNAGIGLFRSFQETSLDDVRRVMEVNLFGAIRMTRAILPGMIERGRGLVVNVASVAAQRGYPNHTAYCASKHALMGWSRSLHKDLRSTGVGVTVVCPPAVRTPFFENAGYMTFDEDHPGLVPMKPDAVAEGIVEAAAARRRESVLSPRARILWALDAFAPNLVDRLQRWK
jgi:uncharacterized protein